MSNANLLAALHPRRLLEGQGILARLRRLVRWPSGKGDDVRVSPVPFRICHHFRRLMIGLNIPVSAECEPDQSNRHQGGTRYDQPMRIIHLSIPGSRSFSPPLPTPPARSRGDCYHVFPDEPKSPKGVDFNQISGPVLAGVRARTRDIGRIPCNELPLPPASDELRLSEPTGALN